MENKEQQEEEQKICIQKKKLDIEEFLNKTVDCYPNTNIEVHKIAVAPMIDVTNTHFRVFMRLLTQRSVVYTEMIHMNAVTKNPQTFLKFQPIEHPVVLQLGGNDPTLLADASKIAEELGYDEINLNVGCPSSKVISGEFGACMMLKPELVATIMKTIKEKVKMNVTVKCRLGVDDFDSYEFAKNFIQIVSEKGGVQHFIIHARKCILKGLSCTENRNIPPLRYDYVMQLKKDFPHLNFTINGGFKTIESIQDILKPENLLAGCMVGRAAYDNPWIFSDFDRQFYNCPNPGYSRRDILEMWGQYGEREMKLHPQLNFNTVTKPLYNLFAGEKYCKLFRQYLSEVSNRKDSYIEFMQNVIQLLEKYNIEALDQRVFTGDIKQSILQRNESAKSLDINQQDNQQSCNQNDKQIQEQQEQQQQ